MLLLALLLSVAEAAPPAPAPLPLADARRAPRVEFDIGGDGAVVLDGRMFAPPPDDGEAADLQGALLTAIGARPDAVAWVRVPPALTARKLTAVLRLLVGAPLRGVVIESPGLPPLVVANTLSLPALGLLPDDAGSAEPSRPPLTVHLRADGATVARAGEGIRTPSTGNARVAWLGGVLAADGAAHPDRALVIVNADGDERIEEVLAVGKLVADTGGGAVLLASGPASPPKPLPPLPERPTGTVERVPAVELDPAGDIFLRAPDATLDRVPHATVDHFEAWCDATVCDLVVATDAGRRVGIGTRPAAVAVPDWLFERPVHTWDGRLGLPEPERKGALSPIVRVPGAEAAAKSAPGVVMGKLPKSAIDDVVKKRMRELRACYAESAKAAGKVTIRFVIAPDGTVQEATVKDTTFTDERFLACMVERARAFTFPPPEGGGIVIVSYPFQFSP